MVEDFEYNYVYYRYERRHSIPLQFIVQIHNGYGKFAFVVLRESTKRLVSQLKILT